MSQQPQEPTDEDLLAMLARVRAAAADTDLTCAASADALTETLALTERHYEALRWFVSASVPLDDTSSLAFRKYASKWRLVVEVTADPLAPKYLVINSSRRTRLLAAGALGRLLCELGAKALARTAELDRARAVVVRLNEALRATP